MSICHKGDNMSYSLYIIVFPNNKKYVGITTNLKARKNQHKNRSNKKEYQHLKLYRAINKYGFKNLKWEIHSDYPSQDELIKAEVDIIAKLKTNIIKFGYNTTDGGEGHLGFSPSAETREKISKANKGKPKPPGFKEHLSNIRKGKGNPMFGKTISNKQKQILSKASSGEKNVNAKLSNKQADEIRNKYKTGKYLIQDLAKIYNLSRNTISKIIKNKAYKSDNIVVNPDITGNHKFTFKQAENIRKMYKTKKYTYSDLGKIFNVGIDTIGRIIKKETYINP
jgi:group I intron endonuclease